MGQCTHFHMSITSSPPLRRSGPDRYCWLPWLLRWEHNPHLHFLPTGRFKLQYSRWCRGFLLCNQSVWEFWKHDSHLFHQSLLLWEASSRKSRGKLASVSWNLLSRPDYCCLLKFSGVKFYPFFLVSLPPDPPPPNSSSPHPHYF